MIHETIVWSNITNKPEKYKELLEAVLPFVKSKDNIEKRAAYDFNIILKSAINDQNSATLLYLNEGIIHVIEFFTNKLLDLINNKINEDTYINDFTNYDYDLIHDICIVILNQILYKNKLRELKEFLLNI
jgi:hypothetical protein